MTQAKPETTSRKVIVGVDGSEHGYAALAKTVELALALGGYIHVEHIRHLPALAALGQGELTATPFLVQLLDDIERDVRDKVNEALAGFERWELSITVGDPAEVMISRARTKNAIAIIVGSHGHRRFSPLLLGSVAAGLLHRSPVSVMLVRSTGSSYPGPQTPELSSRLAP